MKITIELVTGLMALLVMQLGLAGAGLTLTAMLYFNMPAMLGILHGGVSCALIAGGAIGVRDFLNA